LVGPHFAEASVLNFAHLYQKETDWHQRQPGQN
jgi:aspartyl-tRNA(Asn)/glutamyl-tRNA(Gln) amidotransferase subunit A